LNRYDFIFHISNASKDKGSNVSVYNEGIMEVYEMLDVFELFLPYEYFSYEGFEKL